MYMKAYKIGFCTNIDAYTNMIEQQHFFLFGCVRVYKCVSWRKSVSQTQTEVKSQDSAIRYNKTACTHQKKHAGKLRRTLQLAFEILSNSSTNKMFNQIFIPNENGPTASNFVQINK